MSSPRIQPINPPYTTEIQEAFKKIMPPGMEPLNIFRTFAHNPDILKRQMALGAYLLNHGTVDARDREILIHRTCARCGSEYEWGVHVTAFARPLGFSEEKIHATVLADADDAVWSERESLLVRLVDELHEASTVSDELWTLLSEQWTDAQLVELVCIVGMYHAVSFMTNALGIELEPTGARFPVKEESSAN